ncbi:hypothetical protein [Aestuariibaculum suncheonense]|uniref:Uncharacterized protein n=1 Tax=Aestuariibaculum suncheonense TaxID=1028745 RepID=A0A8J6QMN8_9FLAO|nr:hypothetical protein [Aestuariibaculum suncheonense]MBD0836826.1 hypothetical protein [Aestuariibaculum suncheonense]
MKISSLLLCLFILLSGCSDKDKESIDCSVIYIGNPLLLLKITDTNGNNLIENETYTAENISINYNNNTINDVVIDDYPQLNAFINVPLFGTDIERTFKINLSETETDVLIVNVTLEEGICKYIFTIPLSGTYNGNSITIENYNNNYLITVVK